MRGGCLGCPILLVLLSTVSSVSWDCTSCHVRGHTGESPTASSGQGRVCRQLPVTDSLGAALVAITAAVSKGAAEEPVSGVLCSNPHAAAFTSLTVTPLVTSLVTSLPVDVVIVHDCLMECRGSQSRCTDDYFKQGVPYPG